MTAPSLFSVLEKKKKRWASVSPYREPSHSAKRESFISTHDSCGRTGDCSPLPPHIAAPLRLVNLSPRLYWVMLNSDGHSSSRSRTLLALDVLPMWNVSRGDVAVPSLANCEWPLVKRGFFCGMEWLNLSNFHIPGIYKTFSMAQKKLPLKTGHTYTLMCCWTTFGCGYAGYVGVVFFQ